MPKKRKKRKKRGAQPSGTRGSKVKYAKLHKPLTDLVALMWFTHQARIQTGETSPAIMVYDKVPAPYDLGFALETLRAESIFYNYGQALAASFHSTLLPFARESLGEEADRVFAESTTPRTSAPSTEGFREMSEDLLAIPRSDYVRGLTAEVQRNLRYSRAPKPDSGRKVDVLYSIGGGVTAGIETVVQLMALNMAYVRTNVAKAASAAAHVHMNNHSAVNLGLGISQKVIEIGSHCLVSAIGEIDYGKIKEMKGPHWLGCVTAAPASDECLQYMQSVQMPEGVDVIPTRKPVLKQMVDSIGTHFRTISEPYRLNRTFRLAMSSVVENLARSHQVNEATERLQQHTQEELRLGVIYVGRRK